MIRSYWLMGVALAMGVASAENVTTTADMTAGGDWTVTVAAGVTNYVTAVQSGTGKIVKQGGGNLVLSANNTFTGGVTVDEGSVEPHHDNAFGTGAITLNADGTKVCQVAFTKGELTFTNDLTLVGTSAIGKPAFYFHSATNKWNGKITAPTGDFYTCDNGDWCYISTGGYWNQTKKKWEGGSWSTKVSKIQFMTFNGDIDVHGTVYVVPDGRMTFNGAITCDTLDTCYRAGLFTSHDEGDSSFYGPIYFNGINRVRQFNAAYSERQFVGGGLDGALIHWPSCTTHSEGPGKVFFPATAPNRLAGITAVFPRKYPSSEYGNIHGSNTSGTYSQIVVTGLGADAEDPVFACHTRLGGFNGTVARNHYFDFAVDGTGVNSDFVQIFSNRHHTVAGKLAATNGTLRFVGVSSCTNASALVIGANGRIEDMTTYQGSFCKVSKISVASTGKLKLGNYPFSQTFTSGKPSLELETGATVEAPELANEEFRVTSLKIDGLNKQMGVYTASDLSGVNLPAGIKLVVVDPVASTQTATWSGADAADNLMTTVGNWQDAQALPDIVTGFTKVTIPQGEAMTPGEGRTYLHSIEYTVPYADDGSPFVLGAAGETIEVAGSIKADQKGQMIVRGTIAPPTGIGDQGAPSANGSCTFTYKGLSRNKKTWPPNYLQGNATYCVPLVLDGATIAKPYYSYPQGGSGSCVIRALTNSVNSFTGKVKFDANAWSEVTLDPGSRLEFSGGVNSAARIAFYGKGTLVITDKPYSGSNGFTVEGGGTLVLDAENNWFGQSTAGFGLHVKTSNGGNIDFRRSYCLADLH